MPTCAYGELDSDLPQIGWKQGSLPDAGGFRTHNSWVAENTKELSKQSWAQQFVPVLVKSAPWSLPRKGQGTIPQPSSFPTPRSFDGSTMVELLNPDSDSQHRPGTHPHTL